MQKRLSEPRGGLLCSEHSQPVFCSRIAKLRSGKKGKVLEDGFGGVWLLLGNHGHNSQAMDKTQGFGISNERKSSCLGNTVST